MRRLAFALLLFPTSIALADGDPDDHFRRGMGFKKEGRLPDAIQEFEQAVKLRGDDPRLRFSLGVAYKLVNRNADAAKELERAVKLDGKSPEYRTSLGVTYQRLGRLDEARKELEEAVKLDAKDAIAHQSLGAIYRQQKQYDKALQVLEKAIILAPEHAASFANFAVAARHAGDPKLGETMLRRAIEIKPAMAELRFNLCVVLRHQDKLDAAIVECEKAVALDSRLAAAHHDLGLFHESKRNQAAAIKSYGAYLALIADDNPAEADIIRGHLVSLGASPTAGKRDRPPVDLVGATPRERMKFHYLRGEGAFRGGRYDEAIQEFEAAFRAEREPAVLYNIAQSHRLAGRAPEALKYYRLYLELDPDTAIRAEVQRRLAAGGK